MPDPTTFLAIVGSFAIGYGLARLHARWRRRRRRVDIDAVDPGHRHVEVILQKVTASRMGEGYVDYHLVCGLCDLRWAFTNAKIRDNVTVTCPRCGARERIDAVKAAMREDLRRALIDHPPDTQ